MADIDIERKDSVGWLWWVLGLLLVGLVAFLLADALADDDEVAIEDEVAAPMATEPLPEAQPMVTEQPMALQNFVLSCAPRQPSEMGLDHAYTSNCVRELVNAVDAIAPANELAELGLTEQMEQAREASENLIASGPEESRHSEMTRNAFTSIATVIEEIQNDRFPALEANAQELTEAASAVSPDGELLEQREAVQDFFAQAGRLLEEMHPAVTTI
jgi:hypothetical protein